MDNLVGLAPPINQGFQCSEENSGMFAVFKARGQAYKAHLNKLWLENLSFKLNEVQFAPVSVLAKHLTQIFGKPIDK